MPAADDLAKLAHGRSGPLHVTDDELAHFGLRRGADVGVGARDRLLDEEVPSERDELERDVVMGAVGVATTAASNARLSRAP